jgi:hypothetical protein
MITTTTADLGEMRAAEYATPEKYRMALGLAPRSEDWLADPVRIREWELEPERHPKIMMLVIKKTLLWLFTGEQPVRMPRSAPEPMCIVLDMVTMRSVGAMMVLTVVDMSYGGVTCDLCERRCDRRDCRVIELSCSAASGSEPFSYFVILCDRCRRYELTENVKTYDAFTEVADHRA